MAFCTLLEWDEEFPFDRYQEMNTRAGVHESLPDGCLVRVVGQVDGGARVVEAGHPATMPTASATRTPT